MNKDIFARVLANYKANYDKINDFDGRDESYKWPAVRTCLDYWDIDAADFTEMFKRAMSKSQNIIENRYKHPIGGISFLCEQGKTEEIREEFRKLLSDDGDIRDRQKRAEAFVDNINAMLNEIAPEKWSYMQDRRDPIMYLSFIKPADNYMFMSERARTFANYVEFGDDIGSGQTFRLDNYYRLCDEVLEELEADDEMKGMLDSQLERRAEKEGMSIEDMKQMPGKLHIVVYDMMYCGEACGIYTGIDKPVRKGSKEEKERTRLKRIEEIHDEMEKRDLELNNLMKDVPEYPNLEGAELTNIRYGKGKVVRQNGKYLYIDYGGDEKAFALPDCISKGYLKGASDEVVAVCKRISEVAEQQKKLTSALRNLGFELALIE